MSIRTHLGVLVAGAALVTSTLFVGAGTAAATDNMPGKPPSSCSGSLVSGFPKTKTMGSRTLKLSVYYSSANGGTNCAIARKSGSWAGKPTYLSVTIWRSDVSGESSWPYAAYDFGNYKSYAGAAYITHTNGKCINVIADYGYSKDDFDGNMGKFNFACG